MNVRLYFTRRGYRVRLYYLLAVLVLCYVLYHLLVRRYTCKDCELHKFRKVTHGTYECTPMDFTPETVVCLHPSRRDSLSKHIDEHGLWEPHMVRLMQKWLRIDPKLGLIDIGASVGVYTLLAAKMGRQVLAVEPNLENVHRLHRSVSLEGLEDKITLLRNAIGEARGVGRVVVPHNNIAYTGMSSPQPADVDTSDKKTFAKIIFLDDIIGYCKFEKAILKIDIAGYDHRVLSHAEALLQTIDVPYIMMDFKNLKPEYMNHDDKSKVGHMITYLHQKGYIPKDANSVPLSHPAHWNQWPDHMYFELDRRLA